MKDRNGIEIKVSDTVEWVAEASGVKKPREGKVIALLAKGAVPMVKIATVHRNTRSDRVVVECERVHSKGTTKEYLTPVVTRVSVVPKADGLSAAQLEPGQANARSDGLRA